MMNEAHISLTGYVATQPVMKETKQGTPNLTMRVAWTPRRQDRTTGEWVDGNTSYLTVICWRRTAGNVAICLRKGDPVIVKGRLSVRTYDDKEGQPRIVVEVDASSVGHDLSRGVAHFQRVRPQTGMTAAEHAAAVLAAGGSLDGGSLDGGSLNGGSLGGGSLNGGSADGLRFGGGPADDYAGLGAANSTDGPARSERDDDLFDEAAIGDPASEEDRAAVPF
jgi:single-strand DNA-binding protein